MVTKIVGTLASILFLLIAGLQQSFGQIINLQDVDALCRSATVQTHRNTIIYVDLSSLKQGDNEWGYTILQKLELAPRERVTVLGVNPNNFEVLEVFASCYPTFTSSEISQIRNERTLWDKLISADPESQQRDNLQTFDSRLRNSLDKLLVASKNFVPGKRRDILGAIAVDKNRFTDPSAFYRLIIFTNANISGEFGTGASETEVVDVLTKKYPTLFSGAQVFVFGVTGGERNEALESKQKVFSGFFLNNWAHVRSFTPSLPQQSNGSVSAVRTTTGTFDGGGIKGSTKLSLSLTREKSADMWLTFVVGANSLYVPIEGEYSCSTEACALKGTVVENIPVLSSTPYFRKGDKFTLTGKPGEKLLGVLSSEAKEVFKDESGSLKTEDVKYNMEFAGLN
jgi:hypothetical protein